jgi:hypothetical protein
MMKKRKKRRHAKAQEDEQMLARNQLNGVYGVS